MSKTAHLAAILVTGLALLPAAPAAGDEAGIDWLSYEDGLAAAAGSERIILVDFHADWCKYCKKMDRETFAEPGVIRRVGESFVAISVDTQKDPATAQKYGVRSLPTLWFLDADGTPLAPLPGFVAAPMFRDILDYMSSRSFESMSFDDYLKGTEAP